MNRFWRRVNFCWNFFDVTSDEGEDEAPVHHAQQVVKEERQAGVKALNQLKKNSFLYSKGPKTRHLFTKLVRKPDIRQFNFQAKNSSFDHFFI